ncbi:MAG: hypothetical protein V7K88_29615 [Nostoc sp.]
MLSEEYTENGKLNEAETIATLINPALHKKGLVLADTDCFILRTSTNL